MPTRGGSLKAAGLLAVLALSAGCGARTGLGDEPYRTPVLYCPPGSQNARPGRAAPVYAGVPLYADGRVTWSVESAPPGAAVTLTHEHQSPVIFQAATEGAYTLRVTAPAPQGGHGNEGDAGEATVSCVVQVQVRASGPTARCPAELTTAPYVDVVVAGSASGDRVIQDYRWAVVDAPVASGRPPPSPDDAAATHFVPDAAGDFRLQFTATDSAGASDSCTTVVHAVPRENLRVEMYWDPPGRACPNSPGAACDASDVDLHLLRASGRGRPWGTDDDCFYYNCNTSTGRSLPWDLPGAFDDPRLDHDITTGHGPENINVDRPSNRSYRIGVHYYAAHGAGPQAATVLVYCSSPTPVARLGPVVVTAPGTSVDNDFWLVADVLPAADGNGCEVRPILRGAMPYIVPYRTAETDPGPPPP